eukprot:TRINITY_DN2_c0_g2_i2.p1 TRINITY_DN2_c0_g2~~TRINITY_DN2_c0_g2_i2.p1  ORF type:complete len:3871 (+),score=464.35 TRINITY_DN2_c0_g2_i2:339-11951(+)
MLESVLADVLTRVLGQYLEGIDRESVTFGAWSGLVELRGVALRPEALAVLFETLGVNLPVTVEAGFIGLLRLNVPWNAIGTTPVLITLEDITIIARPVRGDGSDDSELQLRDRRIKRARLNTDDAVREASWGVSSETETKASTSWSTWLVSDELRAKVIDNIQVHLKDIIIRFEDPFSDKQRPYLTSVVCESLKIVSANESWNEAFVERGDDTHTRKLMEVNGFRVDWAPITTRDQPGASSPTPSRQFHTPELLRQFVRGQASASSSPSVSAHASSLIDPIDGFMRILLSPNNKLTISTADLHQLDPAVDLDIRFPNLTCNINDAQYTSLLQTSVYFARLATRGVRPKTAKARWVWAIDQLLPGFSDRRKRALRFTEAGIAETKTKRLVYSAYRKSLLKARRTGVEEPREIAEELENIETSSTYEEIIAFRDWIDRQIDADHEGWHAIATREDKPASKQEAGTTTSTFWRMLGYEDDQKPQPPSSDATMSLGGDGDQKQLSVPKVEDSMSRNVNAQSEQRITLALRVAFLLQSVTLNLSQGGFPRDSISRLSCTLQNLRVGVLVSSANDLITEAVLGSVLVRDTQKNTPLVYNRFGVPEGFGDEHLDSVHSAYPTDVSDALESIRDGSNPASDVLMHEEAYSDQESEASTAENQYDSQRSPSLTSATTQSSSGKRRKRTTTYGSGSRDATPPTFRVTEEEFLGTSRSPSSLCRYAAAFRYRKLMRQDGVEDSLAPKTYLDVSIATLEAVVDGPKGSFVWGIKFLRPRGMAQDPIMAFLGAAAGARIAELRMEIEQALVANKVPLQVNAVILAPRFIIPGDKPSYPSLVVNLGTIGACTSDSAPAFGSGDSQDFSRMVRYSNYVMTLDNLGMYFCPSLGTALSRVPQMGVNDDKGTRLIPGRESHTIDTSEVSRIIRPFSLRFMVQTLRDATIVQVARHSSTDWTSVEDNIAKVRVRGTIPEVSLVLTQAAFQHILITADKWSRELLPTTHEERGNELDTTVQNWPVPHAPVERKSPISSPVSSRHFAEGHKHETSDKEPLPTALASYDVRLLLNRVSIELRDRAEMRLLTLTAYHIQGKVVKTGRTSLRACFSLQSWSITDGSRGSTAAYRRLVYAGNLTGSKGVSPPRSTSGTADSRGQETEEDRDFVTIRYDLDFRTRHQRVQVHFLSLHVVCVRETYIRLARYFWGVREYVKANRVKRRPLQHDDFDLVLGSEDNLRRLQSKNQEQSGLQNEIKAIRHTYVVSEFDGLNFQLIASGGVVSVLEMRESKIQYLNEGGNAAKAWGEFRYFSVRDLTSPMREHISVIYYEKPVPAIQRMLEADRVAEENWSNNQDEWVLSIPRSKGAKYELNGNFRGIKITLLYRFCDVISQYFKILWKELEPIVGFVVETGDATNGQTKMAQEFVDSRPSKFAVHLVLNDVNLRLPRHSACASEALSIAIQDMTLSNSVQEDGDGKKWSCRLTDAQFATEYLLLHGDLSSSISVSSSFLTNFTADVVVGVANGNGSSGHQVPLHTRREVWFKANRDVYISLSEAQYTVLYFVLTENLAETVTELDLSLGMDCLKDQVGHEIGQGESQGIKTHQAMEQISVPDVENVDVVQQIENPQDVGLETFIAMASFPSFVLEISRGWDVTQESCKVLGMSLKNFRMLIKLFDPRRLVVELDAKLKALEDLRPESCRSSSEFAVPLSTTENSDHPFESGKNDTQQNLSMVYDKQGSDRPSIFLMLHSLQFDIPLDLFRDLTYLAVPGWPFLESSAFPPDFVYKGRTLNVLMKESQLLLRTYQSDRDRRALALIGEFEVKMEWMRQTGAKLVYLEARQMEISCVHEIRPLCEEYDVFGVKSFLAYPLEASTTPLLYPSNFFVEYVGPLADEKGCRLRLSSESLLCLVNASDIPLLRAASAEIGQKRQSYLSRRAWKQAAYAPGKATTPVGPKEQQRRRALESINVSMDIAAVRCLLSDNTSGQFVPVLETQISSLIFSSHAGNMTEIEGIASMDLFNAEKGWWEPALEPWHLTASISHGQSGARSYIVRSGKRADFNITPTTITAVLTVLRTLSMPERTMSTSGEHQLKRLLVRASESNHRPAVAAFFVRNELGLPVNVNLPSTSHRITISHASEIEVQAQSESLVSSGSERSRTSRESALRCSLTIPSYFSKNVSASEVGVFSLAFFPTESSNGEGDRKKLFVVWEVRMSKGVPVCTLRSQYRILNRTRCPMYIFISRGTKVRPEGTDTSESGLVLDSGGSFPVPVQYTKNEISIRPAKSTPDVGSVFEWSSPLPSLKWMRRVARDTQRGSEETRSARGKQRPHIPQQFVVCKSQEKGTCDFFMKLEPKCSISYESNRSALQGWIDVSLTAPIVLRNNLPRPLFYKVTQSETMANAYTGSSYDYVETIFAAGKVNSLEVEHLHFSGDSVTPGFLSLAYDNLPSSDKPENSWLPEFGKSVSLLDVENGRVKSILTAPENKAAIARGTRELRYFMSSDELVPGVFTVSAGVWVRNRSDTPLEVCSRNSFYGTPSDSIILRSRLPFEEPDEHICLEGPYLSLRLLNGGSETNLRDELDQVKWWTTPSSLLEVKKPISVNLSGKSLILEIGTAVAVKENTRLITIRNESWIMNCTSTPLQWCQTSALDAHGNCPTRHTKILKPGGAHAVHWETKSSSFKAVHLRVTQDHGHSDWIWSPAIPLNIGFSRELPAKMYRPKTHEQYIARVDSKKIGRGSRALVVFPEDRQNPPYRIVNLCKERAVAFSQLGSQERPWLVRGSKSTRYSWDDPLAPPNMRRLSIRILEKEDLLNARSGSSPVHDFVVLSIDVVGERVMVLSDGYEPNVNVNVAVEGATKIVTFADDGAENSSVSTERSLHKGKSRRSSGEGSAELVPVVGWDEIGRHAEQAVAPSDQPVHCPSIAALSDYPMKEKKTEDKPNVRSNGNVNVAIFLNSIGVSLIDTEPAELIYIWAKGILMNIESSNVSQSGTVHIQGFQVDNQLHQTQYPVLLSVTNPQVDSNPSPSDEAYAESGVIAVALQRTLTDDDIIMIKSFQAAVNPFHLSLEDKLISKLIRFLADTSLVGNQSRMDINGKLDEDLRIFQAIVPQLTGFNEEPSSSRQIGGLPSSRRIYVHDFKISSSVLRLTSVGSGAAVAKAAGVGLTASTILSLVLNVENCEFQLAALEVQNVFDSLHHFSALVREYYISQLSNQKMKLLASNALVGNPAALFDAVGTGAKDFFNESGKAKGSAEFIASVGRGSKSLLSHTVGGIMESVSSIPRAVSSGLEKAVGDNAYLAERQRIRTGSGQRNQAPRNPAQGFATGALSFAHGISSGVTGFIREPVQGARQGGAGGLLKGIGKAFIGGVAKPVAGAIDLVAEPAAGLSRQIADDRAWKSAIAERPPRAFQGQSKRLDVYDRRYAIGVCFFKAVVSYNYLEVDTDLIDWVELSEREGRSGEDSDLWAWRIIREFARSMPGSKKRLEDSQKPPRAGSSLDTRVEKTRVALITQSDVIVATLDCKLVDWITLWADAKYEVWSDGKDVVVSGQIVEDSGESDPRSRIRPGNIVNAPWDVPFIERRLRRPRLQERFEDRLACGSPAASDDVRKRIAKVVQRLQEEREGKQEMWSGVDSASRSQELLALGSRVDDTNDIELRSGRRTSSGASELGRLGRPTGRRWRTRDDKKKQSRRGSASLERTVRKLVGSSSRRGTTRGGLRFVIANRLEENMILVVREGQLDGTTWGGELAKEIEGFDAQIVETERVDEGVEVTGCVVYDVLSAQRTRIGEIAVELFCGKDGAASFTTKASHGFHVDFEKEGRHGAFVFYVRESAADAASGFAGGNDRVVSAAGGNADAISDEQMVQQLVDIGFGFEDAVVALAEAKGDMVRAVDLLTK